MRSLFSEGVPRDRRRPPRGVASGVWFVLFALLLSSWLGAQASPPNIVFCIADDWGWPHAPCLGDSVVSTPTFERIAANGVLFEQAYVSAPSCTPSRNAILTGKYHWALGGGANLWSDFPAGETTYPRRLEAAGYFVGSHRKSFGPGKDADPPAAGDRFASPEAFLKARPAGKPFCFWFGSGDPHRPYKVGTGVASGIDLAKVEVPPVFPDTEAVRSDIADYYAAVQRFDRQVGELIALLEAAGALDDTLIVMTGDHGWPFPRGKANLYDLGVRVPLAMMWGRALKQPGRRHAGFVSFVDLAATFYDVAGVTAPEGLHGRSLRGVLANDPGFQPATFAVTGKERHTPCQETGMDGYPSRALRTARYLYIRNFQPDLWPVGAANGHYRANFGDIDDGPTKRAILEGCGTADGDRRFAWSCAKRPAEELYDCGQDPFQVRNLADDAALASVREALREQLEAELRRTGDLRVVGKGEVYRDAKYHGNVRQR